MYKEGLVEGVKRLNTNIAMGLTKPIYKIFSPEALGNFEVQLNNCLLQLKDFIVNENLYPFRVNIFVKSKDQSDYIVQNKLVDLAFQQQFKTDCPPFGAVMQEPEDPYLLIFEVGFVPKNQAKVVYGSYQGSPYCIVDAQNYKEYWTIGAQSVNPDLNILDSSNEAFGYLFDLYKHMGLSFNNIVRQWNYVGEILRKENIDGRFRQHYQMFNESRSSFYGKYRTSSHFPAATGIGMLYLGVCIDSFAVSGNEQLIVVPISNPDQCESYSYGQKVLVGDPDQKLKQNQPPQFERAKLISFGYVSRLMVSGTASIIGQETVGIGNVEEQTLVTIKNIERLSSVENLKRHCPDLVNYPKDISYIRVYVKNKADIEKVRSICEKAYDQVPSTYVVADICRDNLLVEIEAELTS